MTEVMLLKSAVPSFDFELGEGFLKLGGGCRVFFFGHDVFLLESFFGFNLGGFDFFLLNFFFGSGEIDQNFDVVGANLGKTKPSGQKRVFLVSFEDKLTGLNVGDETGVVRKDGDLAGVGRKSDLVDIVVKGDFFGGDDLQVEAHMNDKYIPMSNTTNQ